MQTLKKESDRLFLSKIKEPDIPLISPSTVLQPNPPISNLTELFSVFIFWANKPMDTSKNRTVRKLIL